MDYIGQSSDANDRHIQQRKRNLFHTLLGILVWFILSCLCLLLYALNPTDQGPGGRWHSFLPVLSNSALVSAAFISVGALLGFLFGIPRALKFSPPVPRPPQASGSSSVSTDAATLPQDDRRFAPNTNLEEISDWLTKILVGAGLVQLAVLPGQLRRLADFFHASMPLTAEAALMIILNSFVLGFMGSYLLTRLFLTEAFRTVEEGRAVSSSVARAAQDLLIEIAPGAPKEERDAKYESYIYTCLYLAAPEGFERAIKACLEYLQLTDHDPQPDPNPRILAYQAMAYGQKYDWEQKHEGTKDALESLRKSALEAINKAVAREPKLRQLLRTTWDPNDPTKLRGEENDLEVFFGDPDFKKVLDQPST